MLDLLAPMISTKVVLPTLHTRHEVTVDQAATPEVEEHHEIHQWANGSKDQADEKHKCKACTAGTYPIVVLVFGFRFETSSLRAATTWLAVAAGILPKEVLDEANVS